MAQFLDLTGLSRFKNKNDGIYAKKDGYYQNLGAGVADQLSSTVGIEDKTPYNFRTSGGSTEIGDREELNAVVGGTVAWNQLCSYSDSAITNQGITFTPTGNGVWSFSGTRVNASSTIGTLTMTKNHVYMLREKSVASTWAIRYGSTFRSSASYDGWRIITYTGTTGSVEFGLYTNSTSLVSGEICPQVIDLTLALGSTIADYIYALEQSNTGSGVAYFRKLFQKSYYAYNSGELLSVRTNLHRMVGLNAYNPTTGTAKVVGGNQYQITGAYTALSLDGTPITPDANGKFTPSANGTLTVTGGNNTTTCVHLVWDGERDGEYEPYVAHEYALDDITLRGILKLDASNNLYADGDRYLPNGTVERRYGVVDLGEIAWSGNASSNGHFTGTLSTDTFAPYKWASNTLMICGAYVFDGKGVSGVGYFGANGTFRYYYNISGSQPREIYINDESKSSMSPADFKAAMSGVYLVYELETPTTETASPYQQTQIVDDFGTEEFVDAAVEAGERDVVIPVGHETFYQNNLKAKLEMAPNSPDGDGVYVVQQTNGENEYIPLVIPTELPTAPTDDGTYVLKITVSDGTVIKAWVEEEV